MAPQKLNASRALKAEMDVNRHVTPAVVYAVNRSSSPPPPPKFAPDVLMWTFASVTFGMALSYMGRLIFIAFMEFFFFFYSNQLSTDLYFITVWFANSRPVIMGFFCFFLFANVRGTTRKFRPKARGSRAIF